MNIGVIGSEGKIGQKRCQLLEMNPNVDNVITCDIVPSAMYNDYKVMINDVKLDAVFISLPHTLVKDAVIYALEHNLNVFCEKPPGISLEETKEIKMVYEKHIELYLKFGFNHRYYHHILEAKRLLNSNQFGKILWMKGTYGRICLGDGWRNDKLYGGRGILISQGIHLLDLVRFLSNDEFPDVKSFVSHFSGDWYEDNVFAIMKSNSGITASIHSSAQLKENAFSLHIGCERGLIKIDNLITSTRSFGFPEKLIIIQSDESSFKGCPHEYIKYFGEDHSWKSEINEFFSEDIFSGTIDDAIAVMEIIEKVYNDGY